MVASELPPINAPAITDQNTAFRLTFEPPTYMETSSGYEGADLQDTLMLNAPVHLADPSNDYARLAMQLCITLLGGVQADIDNVTPSPEPYRLYHQNEPPAQPGVANLAPPGYECRPLAMKAADVIGPLNVWQRSPRSEFLCPETVQGRRCDAHHFPIIAEFSCAAHSSDTDTSPGSTRLASTGWRSVLVVFFHRARLMVPFDDRQDTWSTSTNDPQASRFFVLGAKAYMAPSITEACFPGHIAKVMGAKLFPIRHTRDPYHSTSRSRLTLQATYMVCRADTDAGTTNTTTTTANDASNRPQHNDKNQGQPPKQKQSRWAWLLGGS